jgi:lysyl-tRNA synthetase class 1
MFWVDRIFSQIEVSLKEKIASGKTLVIRDEKTASGRVHVGSMRALALHAAIAERLDEAGISHVFKYEINDMDAMDGLPVYLDEQVYEKEMGKPLFKIPSPDGKAKNYAEFFAEEYVAAINEAGFAAEFYRASELYLSGKMNGVIREALDHVKEVRNIYKEIYGTKRTDDWYPLLVICENCGKLGTTKVTSWDGNKVTYTCYPTAVEWAKGCGHSGVISPFDGNAKFPWKVDWPAKWKVVGVDIEGGGKDHYSKGGARDVAREVSKRVFDYPEPFGVPNEFFLVGGKKMSSSKGQGSSAKEIVELVPPHIFRLALYGKDINQQINFDPEGDTIPVLYDQYDRLAENYWAGVKDDDYARLFEYIHPDRKVPEAHFLPRFSQVAFIVQMPHMDLEEEIAKLKGDSLTLEDKREVAQRAEYAKRWLSEFAPEKFVFKLQETLPDATRSLTVEQKQVLSELASFLKSQNTMPDGEAIHHALHNLKEMIKISPGDIFSAVYLAFLGKAYGPKAGWFLSVLDRDFVIARLEEASK